MTEQELLKYCHFYKGEALCPFEHPDQCRYLWNAERWVCEEGCNLIDPTNVKFSLANYVAAFVSKWNPYEFGLLMDVYFQNSPEYKDRILAIYG